MDFSQIPGFLHEAFVILFTPVNFSALVIATFFGLIVGIIPGLTATMSVALLTGLTFGFGPQIAVISLMGVYVGAMSAGSQSAVLLNIPGTPASAATILDGYPLNKQGKAGLAIFLATAGSMFGTIISVIFLMFLTPPLAALGLRFQSYEFFLLALFGIVICGNLSSAGDPIKGWISGFFGLIIATVGLDPISAIPRFSFDSMMMRGGLPLISLMIAIFGIPEILKIFTKQSETSSKITPFKTMEAVKIMARNTGTVVRGGLVGTFVGIIPGVGEDIGGWLSYFTAKTVSKNKERFGKGAYEGVIAVETGTNACVGGALIPVLSLAIPGSTSAAIILAAFFMHGYRPGPLLMSVTPGFLYQVAVYLTFASISMFILARLITRFSIKILQVDKRILMPIVFMFCVIGSYLVRYIFFDIQVMFVFGFIGFLMAYAKFPPAPLLLGIVLGPMAEANLIRGLMLSNGSILPFFTRPISLFFVILIALLILTQLPFVRNLIKSITAKKQN